MAAAEALANVPGRDVAGELEESCAPVAVPATFEEMGFDPPESDVEREQLAALRRRSAEVQAARGTSDADPVGVPYTMAELGLERRVEADRFRYRAYLTDRAKRRIAALARMFNARVADAGDAMTPELLAGFIDTHRAFADFETKLADWVFARETGEHAEMPADLVKAMGRATAAFKETSAEATRHPAYLRRLTLVRQRRARARWSAVRALVDTLPVEQQAHPASRGSRAPPDEDVDDDPAPVLVAELAS